MIECKFITNGIAIGYDGVVKPCCIWKSDDEWKNENHHSTVDIESWHSSPLMLKKQDQLSQGNWPSNCSSCKYYESNNRADSMRGNGNSAYSHYSESDLTLEIRPGTVCNLACQSCWPEASSRVANFYHKAGILNRADLNSKSIVDFKFLGPVKERIRDVVILGGEPFYDKNCLNFLSWAIENLNANILIFTNGLYIDYEFIEKYKSKITLIFSIDAIGRPAEYIRYGSVWKTIEQNYYKCRNYDHVEVRINVTTSAYNFYYLYDLFEYLLKDWPDLVTLGIAEQSKFGVTAIPLEKRHAIIDRLTQLIKLIQESNVKLDQKQNTESAIVSIVNNLIDQPFDHKEYIALVKFIQQMDLVKNISINDYCPELAEILSIAN